MPPSDFRLPDDFPDLTLPEKAELPRDLSPSAKVRWSSESPPHAESSPVPVVSHLAFSQNLQPGERVWAPWKSEALHAGTVDQIEDREAHIRFDDGNCGWVLLEQLLPLTIPVGLRVLGRWQMGLWWYPGTVTDVHGDLIHIAYDDGDKEWARPAALVLPCEPLGPDARPTKVASRWLSYHYWMIPVAFLILLLVFHRGLSVTGFLVYCVVPVTLVMVFVFWNRTPR